MGNKTLCCSGSDHFGSSSKMSLQPNIAAHASFAGCQINLSYSKLLFNEDVDTIVLIVSTRLKMGQNMEDLLKKYGGQSVMNELKQVRLNEGGKLELGQVVYTHAGDMDFDYIIYTVLSSGCETTMMMPKSSFTTDGSTDFQPTESLQEGLRQQIDGVHIYTDKMIDSQQTHERQNIYECMINCLQLAANLGVKSIAFPLLEPFNGHISKSKIAAIMLFAIKQFLKDNSKSSLEEIKISSQDTQVIRLFKYIINHILCDNSETTIDPKNRSALKNKDLKASSIYSSEYDDNEQLDQMKVDDLMKFFHAYDGGNDTNKRKSSF
ncbi:unnamed protein product [Paramecium primaurelia]|uniref:Macro domain-containing protein n=2 Tax=Paramecium TaxID=5884 RepID=A0A8S1YA13_9CILI|nr:unnamed protein product [Paramecium primaurelia]CAD8210905.1 unnamed protein product [Paramecium pentaurelia]